MNLSYDLQNILRLFSNTITRNTYIFLRRKYVELYNYLYHILYLLVSTTYHFLRCCRYYTFSLCHFIYWIERLSINYDFTYLVFKLHKINRRYFIKGVFHVVPPLLYPYFNSSHCIAYNYDYKKKLFNSTEHDSSF